MSKSIDEARAEVAKLCEYFATNRAAFVAPSTKEAHVRQMLIDPLFEALGWDVANRGQNAPQYREVVPEDSLEVEGSQRAPDYTFRVGTLPKFFVEAKKCGVNIKTDAAASYQLRRYGWSAKIAVSILTDFEELAVYDCTKRPKQSDLASRLRILYFRYDEYVERWSELWDVFSREAVWSGKFDQYAASKRKRGTSEVDVEFLKEIEGWRETLARNLALRNKDLSADDLNAAVQSTIDRVVFLRMAEDRGLEKYAQLAKLCEQPDIYARFMREVCRKADEKYNSGLFHFQQEDEFEEPPDRITPKLTLDDKVFKPILESLYFEHGSPYHFGVLPVEILGTVYERFLGKVIRLTPSHQAKIEEKPEVRKAGGVYYTPAYIVDYIVRQTVGEQIEGKSPKQLAGSKSQSTFRVLDMACGSGSFLLGAYQFLLDYYLKWYVEHTPSRHKRAVYRGPNGEWRLTIEERKRILTTHIYGVDIDAQAVEVSKLSLLLKALEGENDTTLSLQMKLFEKHRALPNLSNNIKCGNSLIGPDYFTGRLLPGADELRRINAFDWQREFPAAMQAGGFDCVIGNPPYGGSSSDDQNDYHRQQYQCAKSTVDSFALFMEKGAELLRTGGRFGMIVQSAWVSSPSTATLREVFVSRFRPIAFATMPYDVFGAYIDTVIVVAERLSQSKTLGHLETALTELIVFPPRFKIQDIDDFAQFRKTADAKHWLRENHTEFLITLSDAERRIIETMDSTQACFADVADIQRGVTPFEVSDKKPRSNPAKALTGTVRRYRMTAGDTGYIQFDETLAEFKPERYFRGPRLLLRELISRQFRLQAMFTAEDFVTNKSMQSILLVDNQYDILYLLGLLNSTLLSWYFLAVQSVGRRDDFPKIVLKQTRELPFRPIDFSKAKDKKLHDRIVAITGQIIELHKHHAKANRSQEQSLQRQIDATDAEIDRLVYELYGLTDKEIAIVEEATKS